MADHPFRNSVLGWPFSNSVRLGGDSLGISTGPQETFEKPTFRIDPRLLSGWANYGPSR